MTTKVLRSVESIILIMNMIERSFKVLDYHLKTACIASTSLKVMRRSISVKVSLQKFHKCVLARNVDESET